MKDLTQNYDYARLVEEERAHFDEIVVTEELKEGSIHASSAWVYYWEHVGKVLKSSGYSNLPAYLCQSHQAINRPIEILSLASGYCGHELDLARGMTLPFRITCTDLNEGAFERAKSVARAEGLVMQFQQADLNFITIEPDHYDLIFAHAAIHHVINLEHVFEQVAVGLCSEGIFHLTEVPVTHKRGHLIRVLSFSAHRRYHRMPIQTLSDRHSRLRCDADCLR